MVCPRWLAGVVIIGCAGILVSASPITAVDAYRMGALCRSLPEFLAGMILYRIYRNKWLAHWSYFVGAAVALVSAFATHAPDIVILSAFALIILASPYTRLMDHKTLSFLGDISYSLYMVHILVGIAIGDAILAIGVRNGPVIATIAMAASVLFAIVTYKYVELPARAGFRRWMAPRAAGERVS
jgi:exopolysaccharide production protein ExoZ